MWARDEKKGTDLEGIDKGVQVGYDLESPVVG